ncbi:MAG: hypothetical protein OEY81_02955 [Candidatus Bathyarchaeota archaeon]|nr:hypothetical protein [Candidatus Bathyarchaeota archaeon]
MSTQSPFLTPTFQAVLNRNLIRITDFFAEGNMFGAYFSLKITVGLLKKSDRADLDKKLESIEEQIKKAMKRHHIDLALARESKYKGVVQILRKNLYDVFLELMEVLHSKGYLEKKRDRATLKDWKFHEPKTR